MLPHVIRFNAAEAEATYMQLLEIDNGSDQSPAPREGAEGLARFVTELAAQAGLALRLSQCGVDASVLPKLAADAARQWTTSFNPRPADAAALLDLYRQAF